MLAQALYAQGRLRRTPGEQCALRAEEAAADDIVTQVIWRGVRARLLARAGDREAAEALARDAVALVVEPTDLLTHRADALLDLAEVHARTIPRITTSRHVALSLYEQKGNAVGAARARSLLGHP